MIFKYILVSFGKFSFICWWGWYLWDRYIDLYIYKSIVVLHCLCDCDDINGIFLYRTFFVSNWEILSDFIYFSTKNHLELEVVISFERIFVWWKFSEILISILRKFKGLRKFKYLELFCIPYIYKENFFFSL